MKVSKVIIALLNIVGSDARLLKQGQNKKDEVGEAIGKVCDVEDEFSGECKGPEEVVEWEIEEIDNDDSDEGGNNRDLGILTGHACVMMNYRVTNYCTRSDTSWRSYTVSHTTYSNSVYSFQHMSTGTLAYACRYDVLRKVYTGPNYSEFYLLLAPKSLCNNWGIVAEVLPRVMRCIL